MVSWWYDRWIRPHLLMRCHPGASAVAGKLRSYPPVVLSGKKVIVNQDHWRLPRDHSFMRVVTNCSGHLSGTCSVSAGYSQFELLGKKFCILYALCEQQLSKQRQGKLGNLSPFDLLLRLVHALGTTAVYQVSGYVIMSMYT